MPELEKVVSREQGIPAQWISGKYGCNSVLTIQESGHVVSVVPTHFQRRSLIKDGKFQSLKHWWPSCCIGNRARQEDVKGPSPLTSGKSGGFFGLNLAIPVNASINSRTVSDFNRLGIQKQCRGATELRLSIPEVAFFWKVSCSWCIVGSSQLHQSQLGSSD